MNNILTCPVCKEELKKIENSYHCKNRHSFDIAKEGYVNLLAVNKKNSKAPGDNKEMLVARKDFLNSGAYNQLLEKILYIIEQYNRTQSVILEAGCGEGYYISNIKNNLKDAQCFGFDISKEAIKLASKRSRDVNFYVASGYEPNIKEKSVDVLIVIFAPFAQDEYNKLLADDGICIVVKPNTNHLIELKNQLYDNIKQVKPSVYNKFYIDSTYNLTYTFKPTEENLYNLFKMTPFFYRVSEEKKQKLQKNLKNLPIKADFLIEVLKK